MKRPFIAHHAVHCSLLPALLVLLALLHNPLRAWSDTAAEQFRNPPDSGRMTVYWIWIGPAADKESVDRDLREMKAAGIGGAVLLPIYPLSTDDPSRGVRNLRYLSPEFLDLLRYTASRARELGLTLDVTVGTGWPYGGPSVTYQDAARKISVREAAIETSAGRLRISDFGDGEQLEAVFLRKGDSFREIPLATPGRAIDLPADVAYEKAVYFISTPTGQAVKRSALGAEGLSIDHLSSDALRRYLTAVGEKLDSAVRGTGMRSYWVDSLEVYGGNWTPSFLEKFRNLRGYDLRPLLPTLFSEVPGESVHLRYDFWRTVSELGETEFFKPLQQWAHAKGVKLQGEPYGQPPISLASMQYVDMPSGEHYEWKMFNACRWTSSGSWLFGRRVVRAEAWTWLNVPNRYADTLEQMKFASDMHFLSGINSLMAVSYVLTPGTTHLSEWAPYWGPVFNHQQTWWAQFPHLARYVQRVSHVLQQGVPVADIALLLPTDDALAQGEMTNVPLQGTTGIRFERAPKGIGPSFTGMNLYFAVRDLLHHSRAPEFGLDNAFNGASPLIETMVANGYNFGGVDSSTLPGMRIEGARLQAGIADYGLVVLPGLEGIRPDVMEKIAEFCRSGGTVIASRRLPAVAYGWLDRDAHTTRLRTLVKKMFGDTEGKPFARRNYGKGKVIFAGDETANFLKALEAAETPDIRLESADAAVSFVHRLSEGTDYYFLANLSTERKLLRPNFRVKNKRPEIWDPMTGDIRQPAMYRAEQGGTALSLALEPYGSVIVAFRPDRKPAVVRASNVSELRTIGSKVEGLVDAAGTYWVETDRGRQEVKVERVPATRTVNGPWRFNAAGLTEKQVALPELKSWTELSATRHYAGQASYVTEFHLADVYVKPGLKIALDLGGVRETAEVLLNGQHVGALWKRPYKIDVTDYVRAGRNTLEVRVSNLLINRLLGRKPPDYGELRQAFGERFPDPQEWKIVKEPFLSGLFGPVGLSARQEISFELSNTLRR